MHHIYAFNFPNYAEKRLDHSALFLFHFLKNSIIVLLIILPLIIGCDILRSLLVTPLYFKIKKFKKNNKS